MQDDGMKELIDRARKMRAEKDKRMAATIVEASAAGGRIVGRMDAHRTLLTVHVDPELVRPEGREHLEREVGAVINELVREIIVIRRERFSIIHEMPDLDPMRIAGR